jgi:HK97 family phage portal protein
MMAGWGRLLSPRPSESDLGGQIQWAVDRRLGAADYASLPAVSRARAFIVSIVAELEPVAWRDGFPMDVQPALVTAPAPGETRETFLGQVAGSLFDHSNAFCWLPATGRNAEGYPDVAVVLPFGDVHVSFDESGLFRRYRWRDRDLVAGRDILHVELPGRKPGELLVPSKFDTNADALDRVLAAEYYAGDWFGNGGVPSIVLKYAGVLNDLESDKAKARWLENHQTHSPGILPQGWDFSEIGGDPQASQLLETRMQGVLEVARIWGIVPEWLLVAALNGSSMQYANVAQALDTFMRVTGQPEYLSPIESALSTAVPRTQSVRFSTTELFRLAEGDRITTEAAAIGAGIYTLPEVRRSHGLPVEDAPRIPPALAPTPAAPAEVAVNA